MHSEFINFTRIMENKDTAIETTITRKSENEEIEIILDNKHLKDLLVCFVSYLH